MGEPPGPIDAVLRQLGAVRRRKNLRLAQHAAAVWVAIVASAAAGIVLAAIRAGGTVFLLAALLATAGVVVASVVLARRIARDWLPAGAAASYVDTTRALRGRVSSLTGLRDATHGDLYALLLRQNLEALPRWRAEDVVPEVVPARAFAGAVSALVALALMIVLAPTLRRPQPHVVVSHARMDFQAAPGTVDGAEQLVVAPGTEHPAPEDDGATASTRPEDEPGIATALTDASSALQDWLEHTLGVDDHWEPGEPMPASEQQHARRSAQDGMPNVRPPTGDGEAKDGDDAHGADGEASRRADGDRPATQTPGGGGGGAGAGSDTDPSLYGEAHDGPGRAGDRFELAIAARVRTRRGAAMERWTTAPDPEADRQPALAGRQRAEQPGHRMAIPASLAPLVRRLYAHATQGDAP